MRPLSRLHHPSLRLRITLLMVSMLWLMLGCVSGHREPYEHSGTPLRDLGALHASLSRAVARSPQLSLQVLGHVFYKRFAAPIWSIHFKPDGPVARTVFISAGIHGNEAAGVYCLLDLIESLADQPIAYRTTAMHIIPLINPWGWAYDQRFTPEGIDINRDFTSLLSQEAQIIRAFIETHAFDRVIALHQDASVDGFYLYQFAAAVPALGYDAVEQVRFRGHPIARHVRVLAFDTHNGVLDVPLWSLWYLWATRQIGMAGFCRLFHTPQAFTLETPSAFPIPQSSLMYTPALQALTTAADPRR